MDSTERAVLAGSNVGDEAAVAGKEQTN